MKNLILALALIVSPVAAQASTPAEEAFSRMKTLAGTWNIIEDGQVAGTIEYKVASGGHALTEYFEGMVTVYHLDGETLLATHYCSAGNQPRMRAAEIKAPYTTLDFKFEDITNLKPGKMHIAGVKFEWVNENKVNQTWIDRKDGKDSPFTFAIERVAAPAPVGGAEHVHN